ncbi:MAG: single-stranded DNA-binding protein [Oscillospiraceae bacterium]
MLNHIVIMGRLARDPELRHTQTGTPVASFTLAVDRDFKDKNTGERQTDWIDVVAWRGTGEFVSRYFSKGRMAVVEGRLQIRDWTDKEGNKRRSAEVVADNVYFGDSKRDGDGGSYGDRGGSYGGGSYGGSYGARPSAPSAPADYGIPSGGDQFAELADDDGDLPF